MLAGTRKELGDSSTARSESDGLDKILYDQPSDWDVVEAVKDVAKQRDAKPAQVALAWMLGKRVVAAPIIGATKLKHLEEAIGAVEIDLSKEEVAQLEAPYRAHPVKGLAPARLQRRERSAKR